jgi:hypothetical protein
VPPEQCPDCGRFLTNTLIDGLAAAPAACPACGIELTAVMFDPATPADPDAAPASATSVAAATPAAATAPAASSVRPPDLAPETVRDAPDPLAGWDAGVPTSVPVAADARPFPTDTVVVVGAGLLGLVVGTLVGERRGRRAALGALGGVVGAGAARRIWRLP